MLFNIITFLVILLCLTIILNYSLNVKEGFFNIPVVEHQNFVKSSEQKFNSLTNTINLTDPIIPINAQSINNLKSALKNLSIQPTADTYNLDSESQFNPPDDVPDSLAKASICEKAPNTCSAFDDPVFAQNCGMGFDTKGIGSDGKAHIGGLYISPEDRKKQIASARAVKETGSSPYDPYKVYQPTIGKAKPGTFSLTKDQCTVVKEKVDCETKQNFESPNCTQCYTSQKFSRIGPETERLPSIIFLAGNGIVSVTSTNNIISLNETTLYPNNVIELNIPSNAEGIAFDIRVNSNNIPPTYLSGFLQGQTSRGPFKIDLNTLIQNDKITNTKPRINGTKSINGFRSLSIIPGNGKTQMVLSCLMPFSFLNMFDTDAINCDNGPIITKSSSATFLESDPCFGKDNKPGKYKLECLQSRWIALGGSIEGTGYPSNQLKANQLQFDQNGNPLSIENIVDNLSIKMIQAQTGKDTTGRTLSISEWNDVSMFALGIPINTPCDGPNKENGPLSKDCLSYLYLNQGVNSHIGATYSMMPGKVASMKNQDIPNTYCQLGTSIDPSTPQGLQFGQRLGGIDSVKQKYDEINRLANDNTKTNTERADAVKQCYGIDLLPISSNDIKARTYRRQKVYGNNGTTTCESYCSGYYGTSWNGELPQDWNGANCVGHSPNIPNCNSTFDLTSDSYCECEETGNGWDERGWRSQQ